MLRSPIFSGVAMIVFLSPLFVAWQLAWAGDELPRYKLHVGQELQYTSQDEFVFDRGKFVYDITWHVWVVKENADGSWRLVIRYATVDKDTRYADDQGGKRESVTFAWCDLDPSGQLPENESFGYRLTPFTLLVKLPERPEDLKSGWTRVPSNRMLHELSDAKYLPGQSTADKMVFEVVRHNAMNEIYGFEFKDTVTFDVKRGLPEKIDSYTRQTYGFDGEGHAALQLTDIKERDSDWCASFGADAQRYFAAKKAFDADVKAAQLTGDAAETKLQEAAARLNSVRDQIQALQFREQIAADLKQHEDLASYYVERAKNRAAMLGSPSADWTCKDFAGKEHALKDYRGRVVVLDFWYRGCGWCIRAMPQVKEVAAHFKDQPVTIFGMNTDKKDEDAQFVIDKMALNYDNLKATGIPEKYKVRGFPTLIILDQEGVIRDLHNGYSPDLKEKVIESIERLLLKKS
jgi:thiol-disulfide isomerase/thioredoxin